MTMAIGIIQGTTKIVAVDTAISTEINNKHYRTDVSDNKCFIKDNSLIFCSGNIYLANKIRNYICQMEKVDVKEISRYAKQVYDEFKIQFPLFKKVNLWIWVVDKDHFWEFGNDENNFQAVDTQNNNGIGIRYSGYFEENGKEINDMNVINATFERYMEQCMQYEKNIIKFCINLIKHYNCEAVGGVVKFFTLDDNTNKFIHLKDVEIDDKHKYARDELKQMSCLSVNATVSIKKGNFNINDNFIVDKLGNSTMKSINIANKIFTDENGNLKLDGGNISWISHDPNIAIAQGLAADAQSSANSANVIATSASGNIKKLADGTYVGGTFINGKSIESPRITSGEFYGGSFNSFDGNSRLDILDANEMPNANVGAGMALYKGESPIFYVGSQLIGTTDFYAYNTRFLRIASDGTIIPHGAWNFGGAEEVDFTNVNVKGLNSVAKFA